VFSVTAAPEDLVFEIGHAQRLRPLVNVVVPNGALFIITGAALERGLSWFDGMAYGYTMPKDRSLDIDTELDLEVARMIASKQQATCRAAERYCEFETRIDRK
jgi:CMP-N-acetylneuraminic acid synthetase